MSTERLFLVDPYNEKQMEMLKEFDSRNKQGSNETEYLQKTRSKFTREEYQKKKKSANEIEESLFIEKDSKIVDICHIVGEKDIKTCRITFTSFPLSKKRRLIGLATDYALNVLEMQEVFINVSKEDKNLLEELTRQGFENLGEEQGKNLFLKEQDEKTNIQRKIA